LFEQANTRALAGNYAELRWQSACELGRLHHYAGRVREGAALLDTAIAELQRSSPDSPALIECFEQKSDLELTRQNVPWPSQTAQASLAQAQRLFPASAAALDFPARAARNFAARPGPGSRPRTTCTAGRSSLLKQLGRERDSERSPPSCTTARGIVRSDIGDIAGAAKLFESALSVGSSLWVGARAGSVGQRDVRTTDWCCSTGLDEAEQHFASALRQSGGEEDAEDADRRAGSAMLSVNRERGQTSRRPARAR
jgi:tetratricopeptide (TPR) repeat protein